MKNVLLAVALVSTFASSNVLAQEAAAGPNELTFNAAVTSDYRYRGISQSRLQPALQGGADFTNKPSGLYVGIWASTIKWTKDAGGSGDVEIDLYAGKRGDIGQGFGYDVGVLTYVYPSNGLADVSGFANANTTELYGQLSYGPGALKYSHAVTNLFGFVDSKNSGYLDLSVNPELVKDVTLNLHAGRQRVDNNGTASYIDWKVGVTHDFGVVTGALAYIGTNAGKVAYASPANGKFLGKSALQLTISKTF
ncbi:TorF family putative porin [Massilia sp. PWRC2]|uniref:TorF family putative porin n=1 Tax=Massilia sp. PWRC2 TaxID=2804626 RepID=UPI003CFADE52